MVIKQKSKKTLLVALAMILIISILLLVTYLTNRGAQNDNPTVIQDSKSKDFNTPATNDEIDDGKITKENSINPPPNNSSGAALTVSANKVESYIQIHTQIDEITASGSCTLTLSSGSTIIEKGSVEIQPLPEYSTCKGWDIAISDLPTGTWTVKVIYSAGLKTTTTTTEVTI